MTNASTDPAKKTALIAISNTDVTIVDSMFQGLDIPQDTLLYLGNSSAILHNVTFRDNQAALSAAFMAEDMQDVSIQNSTFISNTGITAYVMLMILLFILCQRCLHSTMLSEAICMQTASQNKHCLHQPYPML